MAQTTIKGKQNKETDKNNVFESNHAMVDGCC